MRFGFGLITCQRYPGDPRSDVELYADALELAAEAERLGFDSVWTSEHHFVDDAYVPSVLPLCAAIAARTDRVLVGTALLLAPLHEPVRIAEDAAVVDLISGGRLVLGIGLGWREEEFDGLHVPIRERVARLEDSIRVYRQAWSGELVTGGEHLRYPSVAVRPRPATSAGPPIWIGAMSEPAVRRAGRLG
ncbi:MAG TPA: LLM class flavin-dependent oxidoreductase, partial [Actinomycetota bacterium]|nr:LLM class flavin-dependent oxidoreductase [Actinomycetota bacterium]